MRLALIWTLAGEPGVVMASAQGEPMQTMSFEFDERDLITAIYVVRNPEKLRHLAVRH